MNSEVLHSFSAHFLLYFWAMLLHNSIATFVFSTAEIINLNSNFSKYKRKKGHNLWVEKREFTWSSNTREGDVSGRLHWSVRPEVEDWEQHVPARGCLCCHPSGHLWRHWGCVESVSPETSLAGVSLAAPTQNYGKLKSKEQWPREPASRWSDCFSVYSEWHYVTV